MRVLFCNVGWMEHYQGLNSRDQIARGGAYVDEYGRGFEVCNFAAHKGVLYGYVQPPGEQIDIERMGAGPNDESIDGITVVWTATRSNGGTVVVGWYKDATVFRNCQKWSKRPASQRRNGIDEYWITAPSDQGRLLPVDERTLKIPRRVKGGMGQSNVWYADKPENAATVKQVLSLIRGRKVAATGAKGRKGKQDQERKAKIEQAAIRLCCRYFGDLGYAVNSVEQDNVGWDLEATLQRSLLQIEVKGLSGNSISVELTPNEYEAFSKKSDQYRLAVVTNALSSPELFICRYSKEKGAWVIDDQPERSIQIKTKQSASVKCV